MNGLIDTSLGYMATRRMCSPPHGHIRKSGSVPVGWLHRSSDSSGGSSRCERNWPVSRRQKRKRSPEQPVDASLAAALKRHTAYGKRKERDPVGIACADYVHEPKRQRYGACMACDRLTMFAPLCLECSKGKA